MFNGVATSPFLALENAQVPAGSGNSAVGDIDRSRGTPVSTPRLRESSYLRAVLVDQRNGVVSACRYELVREVPFVGGAPTLEVVAGRLFNACERTNSIAEDNVATRVGIPAWTGRAVEDDLPLYR